MPDPSSQLSTASCGSANQSEIAIRTVTLQVSGGTARTASGSVPLEPAASGPAPPRFRANIGTGREFAPYGSSLQAKRATVRLSSYLSVLGEPLVILKQIRTLQSGHWIDSSPHIDEERFCS